MDYKLISICQKRDIIVSQDYGITLALSKGAYAIHQSGKWYTNENIEKEIEIKREIEKVRPETGHPSHTYGRYQNVFLTDEELADLQASFPTVWGQYIEKLSEYMASTGKRYQSHVATIRRWAGEDAKKAAPPTRNRDYSVKEDETV